MNRRGFLKNSVSIAALLAVPAPVLAVGSKLPSVSAPVMKSFAVGTDTPKMDWEVVWAESAEMAERVYAKDNWIECDCQHSDEEYDCYITSIESRRVPEWDGLSAGPSATDWIKAGLSIACEVCEASCETEEDVITIDAKTFIVCEYCRCDVANVEINLPALLGIAS